MNHLQTGILVFIFVLTSTSGFSKQLPDEKLINKGMMIRIAEIEIDSVNFEEYTAILKEEAEASVRIEPGVICIYPMFETEKPTLIRLLEIYENRAAYESHLQTPHFQHYKSTTLKMVKSLRLVDMTAIDLENMHRIFKKKAE